MIESFVCMDVFVDRKFFLPIEEFSFESIEILVL